MSEQALGLRQRVERLLVAAAVAMTVLLPASTTSGAAAANERSLYLYFTHTKETARIVYKRNGQYVQSGINQINQFLRDWRRNEPAKMDPALLDLVWTIYQEVGATKPINIVSAYRSPATNAMLRANSSGVAENSQHMQGKAMDFFIPGVPLDKLRATAMKHNVGGVGYYPTSGSPFVHVDTGSVRAWPRMTRTQLAKVFPDGKTLHLPTDGKPLSEAGRRYAQAEWNKCRSVPCSAAPNIERGGGGTNLMDMLFGSDDANVQTASLEQPATSLRPAPAVAPVPMMRPGATQAVAVAALDDAVLPPIPLMRGAAVQVAAAEDLAVPQTAAAALAALDAPVPASRADMPALVAYAPSPLTGADRPQPDATVTGALPPAPSTRLPVAGGIRTAALGPDLRLDTLTGLLEQARNALEGAPSRTTPPSGRTLSLLGPTLKLEMRDTQFVAPDLEHVTEIFMTPTLLTASQFGVMEGYDQADFDPATEMGAYGMTNTFTTGLVVGLAHDRFLTGATAQVAQN